MVDLLMVAVLVVGDHFELGQVQVVEEVGI